MTEAIQNALTQIREISGMLMEKANDPSLSRPERLFIEHAISILDEQEDILKTGSLQEMITQLNVKNQALHELIVKIGNEADKTEGISNMVQKIASVIGVLIEITSKGIGAGLIDPSRKLS